MEAKIYTIAKRGTKKRLINQEGIATLRGQGSDLTNEKMQNNRCKKKLITQILMLNLIKIAETKKDKELMYSFWNTYNCQKKIKTFEGRAYAEYCKNRFCTVCLGIRKAEIIKIYYPTLSTWQGCYFVTLTAKSVPAKSLKHRFFQMKRGLNLIIDKYEKRHRRGKGKKLIGLCSLECNYNPNKRTYNPHFHLIVRDKETAEILKMEWLKLLTSKFASIKAQDIQPVYNLETGLEELIKYGTKVFTEPINDANKGKKQTFFIYVKAFYNIISAMKGHKLLSSFGFRIPKEYRITEKVEMKTTEHENWAYNPKLMDWENIQSKERLNNYLPSDELIQLLFTDKINVDLE